MDINTWQILWGINSLLLAIMVFLHNSLRAQLKKLEEANDKKASVKEVDEVKVELGKKASTDICVKIHRQVNASLHRHANSGQAGEVVPVGTDGGI